MNLGLISSKNTALACCSTLLMPSLSIPLSEPLFLGRSNVAASQGRKAPEALVKSRCCGSNGGLGHDYLEATTSGKSSHSVRSQLRRAQGRSLKMLAKATGVDAAAVSEANSSTRAAEIGFTGVHHVGLLCENLERSLDFYCGLLGLELNPERPSDKLPYRGAWLWVGGEMIHLMELPNPDPKDGRPSHGGRDRHACLAVKSVPAIKDILDQAGLPYTMSQSGRAALFTRDPDSNALEFTQV